MPGATWRRALALAVALLVAAAGDAPREPAGYRTEDYQAPTPLTLAGARVLTTEDAYALWRDRAAVFVDVLPRPPRPAGLPAGTLWRPKPRDDIPGSVWLADAGYGALPPPMEGYFEQGLRNATGGDKARSLVIYCRDACWHSWNAAKRAVALGYTGVGWYRAGTEGWAAAGHPLEPREPLPRPDLTLKPAATTAALPE
jgi:PQQ-dependent catabolism-associated CXXCW motif protein